ncbi:HNH endonuclease [Anabaena sp. UHCC 0187]|jgi:predicted HNH restriction endonuclease|uniref:HNH endonuclease signature motif containing protein n=1 Tax=Anabaena sp. UHCC 0187 TaxID=2590018 RepID=UPI001447EC0D|nr:HNH endonuclease signature motif containing protein [Anabaena sp. UHCC 0187]MBS3030724.1 HNH endonuclease [Dolichospermum sp. DET66]MBS3035960.1 HNH endonuclease [Dolichospermum sp. DET67]MBS3041128.1 HNH endonuclease [Dolichospermum sp. DET50]QSX71010.1 MAG: HNH endonuclease [Dolichospermum sp. DET69]MTJ14962.1 HNH endonuclease [Anabaena sp. UHCC 0187]
MDYPKHWKELAKTIKEKSDWCCQKCGQVLRPDEKPQRRTYLQVHHWNRDPSDNRPENLVALCPRCHLNYHRGSKGNISVGQLSLFDISKF